MRSCLLFLFANLFFFQSFSQEKTAAVLNDSTELQQTEEGQTIKVRYLLNGVGISLKDKDKLLATEAYVPQEFNIRNVGNEIVGEVNFLLPEVPAYLKKEVKAIVLTGHTLDMLKNNKGRAFPDFNWTSINGNKLSLPDLKGKTVVLNFWHTSCVPCVAEMPLLNTLVQKYAGSNVVFIASTPNNEAELQKFLKRVVFQYEQVPAVDPQSIFDPFPGWPIHVVLDSNGTIKFHAIGKQRDIEQKLMHYINETLAEATNSKK